MLRMTTLSLLIAAACSRESVETSALALAPTDASTPGDAATGDSVPPDSPVDSAPDARVVESRPPGPLVSWATDVRQVVPYSAAPGPHRVTVRLTGNNGQQGMADGVTLSIDGGVPCAAQVRPPDTSSQVGGTTVCSADVVSLGVGDSLTLDLHEATGYEGWTVEHEYVSVDGLDPAEVTGP
jgi:hypothetical protein